MKTRILIADDQDAVRHGFRMMLDAQPDLQVIAEAADGITALELARALRPDVVLADVRMPRLDGLELTRRLAGPDIAEPIPVVVVTTFDLDEYVHTALRNGASGFLLKRSGAALLAEAVRAAVAGDALISPSITIRLLQHMRSRSGDVDRTPDEQLSERELEVARLVAEGKTNSEIGRLLFISAGTAKTHIANIQRKLGVRNRVGIALWTWQNGYVR